MPHYNTTCIIRVVVCARSIRSRVLHIIVGTLPVNTQTRGHGIRTSISVILEPFAGPTYRGTTFLTKRNRCAYNYYYKIYTHIGWEFKLVFCRKLLQMIGPNYLFSRLFRLFNKWQHLGHL